MLELTKEQALIIAVALALTVMLIGFIAGRHRTRVRRAGLRQRFGREYDRAVEEYGTTEEAEKMLLEREDRLQRFKVHALGDNERSRYAEDWRGVQARFTDPATGLKTYPASVPNRVCDYVMGALQAGLRIEHLSEHDGDADLAQRVPRLQPYVGWPMLLMMMLTRA